MRRSKKNIHLIEAILQASGTANIYAKQVDAQGKMQRNGTTHSSNDLHQVCEYMQIL